MRKADVRVLNLDQTFVDSRVQRLKHLILVSIGGREELDRGPSERGREEQDVSDLALQPGDPAAE
jgi:hypothetical protein